MAIDGQTDLQIERVLRATPAQVWRAWSDPMELAQWWCPRPWTTEVRAFDLRAGGAFHTFMSGPDGSTSDNPGLFLEVLPATRIVFTSVLGPGWRPHASWLPMTAIITLQAQDAGCRYTATVLHPDAATRDRHAAMGFEEGWGICIQQLEAHATRLG